VSFKYKLLAIVSPLVILLDQLTKWLIVSYLPLYNSIPVIPGFFDIVHVRNTGAAFGVFASSDAGFREPFFYIVAVIAITVLVSILRKLTPQDKLMSWVVALVAGGLVGNLIDRLRFGNVVDFLSFHWRDAVADWNFWGHAIHFRWEWPSFNVADSAITIAMLLLVVQMLFSEKK
jgi:signal peptidase II